MGLEKALVTWAKLNSILRKNGQFFLLKNTTIHVYVLHVSYTLTDYKLISLT